MRSGGVARCLLRARTFEWTLSRSHGFPFQVQRECYGLQEAKMQEQSRCLSKNSALSSTGNKRLLDLMLHKDV